MKTVLVLLLSIVTVLASAMPARRPFRKPLKPAHVETHHPVSWKTIAAGGVAAGTVIAAYKISDGVEDGMKIAAKEEPEAFADSLSVLTWPIRWAAMIFFLVSGCWITKKLLEFKTTSNRKDTTCNSH